MTTPPCTRLPSAQHWKVPLFTSTVSSEDPTLCLHRIFMLILASRGPYLWYGYPLTMVVLPSRTGQDSLSLKLYIITWPVSSFQQSMLANYCWGKLKRHIPDVSLESWCVLHSSNDQRRNGVFIIFGLSSLVDRRFLADMMVVGRENLRLVSFRYEFSSCDYYNL